MTMEGQGVKKIKKIITLYVNDSLKMLYKPTNYQMKFRFLIQTAMDCKNITVYTDSVEALNNTCPSEGISVNVDWITQTSKYLINKVDRLVVKNYKIEVFSEIYGVLYYVVHKVKLN